MNGGKRVLLFEDDVVVQKLLVKLCGRIGVQMDVAGDAAAIENMLAGADAYDMFFVDLVLPGISGWEILQKLKSGRSAGKPIVILTGAVLSEAEKAKIQAETGSIAAIMEKDSFSIAAFEALMERHLLAGERGKESV